MRSIEIWGRWRPRKGRNLIPSVPIFCKLGPVSTCSILHHKHASYQINSLEIPKRTKNRTKYMLNISDCSYGTPMFSIPKNKFRLVSANNCTLNHDAIISLAKLRCKTVLIIIFLFSIFCVIYGRLHRPPIQITRRQSSIFQSWWSIANRNRFSRCISLIKGNSAVISFPIENPSQSRVARLDGQFKRRPKATYLSRDMRRSLQSSVGLSKTRGGSNIVLPIGQSGKVTCHFYVQRDKSRYGNNDSFGLST